MDMLQRDGYARVPGLLSEAEAVALAGAFGGGAASAGIRNVLSDVSAAQAVAVSPSVRGLVEPVLGRNCVAVRGLLFDKTPDANWKVIWHQDLSLAMRGRRDISGWGPWSEKAGVPHVQPPAGVLEQMLAVRLHLDPCGPENGPLRVLPGTHRLGRLDAASIARLRSEIREVTCKCDRGDALLMRPLLLHASSAAQEPGRRRVLHIEYAASDILPVGLHWHEAYP